jgi:hypothetical protein
LPNSAIFEGKYVYKSISICINEYFWKDAEEIGGISYLQTRNLRGTYWEKQD